jgi:putative aldouronate transport system permease protein
VKDKSLGGRIFDVFNYLFMALLILAMLYPLYYVFITSISNGMAVMQGRVDLLPIGPTLDTFKVLLQNESIFVSMKNTVIYTVFGTVVSLVMSCLCAYPLSRPAFSGRRALTGVVVLTMFFSGGMIPLYLVVRSLNMLDTIWAVILPVSINTYNMIIIRTSFSAVPESMIESAQLDGANDFTILFRFVIPVSKAVLATMLLFYAVSYWNSYFNEMLYLNSSSKYPMQIILRNMLISGIFSEEATSKGASSGFTVSDSTLRAAVIIFTTLPILIVYPFVQRHFVKGVMIGSLKG